MQFRFIFAVLVLIVAAPAYSHEFQLAKEKSFVIIAPRSFQSSLADFVAHKKKSLPTDLVALEDVLTASSGVDDPEKVKRYLFDRWKSKNLGYALLVGGVTVMPVRYMVLDRVTPEAFDYAFYPSDLYYADLAKPDGSFEDWNGRKDGFHAGYFGEVRGEKNKDGPINYDGIDYRPEIAVGRWPVATPEQAALIAAKTIRFESAFASGDKPGGRMAGLVAVDGWVDGRNLLDQAGKSLGSRYTIEKRYYGHKPAPNENEISTLLKAGAAVVFHSGHGDSTCWEKCCSINTLKKVKNADRLPVLISAGCGTGYFASLGPYEAYTDVNGVEHRGTTNGEVFKAPPPPPSPYQKRKSEPTSFAEVALFGSENGAVAYVGCNTGSQPCGLTLLEGFAKALGKDAEPRLGSAWSSAICHYYDAQHLAALKPTEDWYPPSIFFQGMKFMLFGDPTLRMPD